MSEEKYTNEKEDMVQQTGDSRSGKSLYENVPDWANDASQNGVQKVRYVGFDPTPLTKKEMEKCRHKSEKRWYRFLCVLNFLAIISIIIVFCVNFNKNMKDFKKQSDKIMDAYMVEVQEALEEVEAEEEGTNKESSEDGNVSKNEKSEGEENTSKKEKKKSEKKAEKKKKNEKSLEELMEEIEVPDEVNYMVSIVVVLILLPFILNVFYQNYRTMSVHITENNFPEVYEMIQKYAKKMGMKKVPEAYIVQQNGILNAFSAFIIKKQYITIAADLFEIAYREHHDMDSLGFVVAHEMSHIYYKHATFGYNIKMLFTSSIPILGSTASRAREYSCDRLAQKVSGCDGIDAMFMLTVGKHLYKSVDRADYIEYAKGVRGFFVWCANLVADHPVTTKRILALEKGEGNGKLY